MYCFHCNSRVWFCKCIPFALCKVVKIDKNEAENGGDVCCCYFAVILLICGGYKDIGQ